MSQVGTRARLAEVVSELGGPSPLLLVALLQVGIPTGAVGPTIVLVVSIAVLPYLSTVWMARAGKVSGRFVSDRRQRLPILFATIVVVVLGLVIALWMNAPPTLTMFALMAVIALLVVTAVTLAWKISIHETIAVFFAGLQVILYGPIGVLAVAIPIAVAWARLELRAHTVAQLCAGGALGAALATIYATSVGAVPWA